MGEREQSKQLPLSTIWAVAPLVLLILHLKRVLVESIVDSLRYASQIGFNNLPRQPFQGCASSKIHPIRSSCPLSFYRRRTPPKKKKKKEKGVARLLCLIISRPTY